MYLSFCLSIYISNYIVQVASNTLTLCLMPIYLSIYFYICSSIYISIYLWITHRDVVAVDADPCAGSVHPPWAAAASAEALNTNNNWNMRRVGNPA